MEQGEADNLPFSSNSFDLILACELLEHLPNSVFNCVSRGIVRVAKKYIIITVPYQEQLQWNYARCPRCRCVFNGAYHVRSFEENDIRLLFRGLGCVSLRGIVPILNPDRTNGLELFTRHHLALEYLFYSASIRCPLCLSPFENRLEGI